jgi:hypothetical protein
MRLVESKLRIFARFERLQVAALKDGAAGQVRSRRMAGRWLLALAPAFCLRKYVRT